MPGSPSSPQPVTDWRPEYIPAYLSNGMIGLRAGPFPLLGGIATLDGLASIQADERVVGFSRAPYPLAGDVGVDGYSLQALPQRAQLLEQVYDFGAGELRTRFKFAGKDADVILEVLTFCSRSQPSLVVQEIVAEVTAACRLRLSAMVDPTGVPGRWLNRETRIPGAGNPLVDGCLQWEAWGGLTSCGAAYHTDFAGDEAPRRSLDETLLMPLETTYEVAARPGRKYRLRQLTSLVCSQLHQEPHRQATRLATVGALLGFEELRAENQRAWNELWKGRVVLGGAGRRWQGLVDAAFFYLHASAHASSLFSTSMFGLAYWPNYHYYRGHVMWDIEAFAFPPLLLTDPEAAAALLSFRSRGLTAAEDNAALRGRLGIQFPWASSPLHGHEVLRTDTTVVNLEEHVNMAVARAFALYWQITGDEDFLRDQAWPVLSGVARWILSRASKTPRGLEILRTDTTVVNLEEHGNMAVARAFALYWQITVDEDFLRDQAWPVLSGVARWVLSRASKTPRGLEILRTLGIAEGREQPIDNSSYVNLAAAATLREAARAAHRLSRSGGGEHWRQAAERFYIPTDAETGVILNHERFSTAEPGPVGATPETLAALLVFGERLPPGQEQATIAFYLDRVEPYLGHPMMSAPLGAFAAWLGDRDRAASLYEAGYSEFVNEPFLDPNEFSRTRYPDKPVTGPFFANLGGLLHTLLLELPGLQPSPDDPGSWPARPVCMPSLWDSVEVERLWIRGAPIGLRARHGAERAELVPG